MITLQRYGGSQFAPVHRVESPETGEGRAEDRRGCPHGRAGTQDDLRHFEAEVISAAAGFAAFQVGKLFRRQRTNGLLEAKRVPKSVRNESPPPPDPPFSVRNTFQRRRHREGSFAPRR